MRCQSIILGDVDERKISSAVPANCSFDPTEIIQIRLYSIRVAAMERHVETVREDYSLDIDGPNMGKNLP